MNENKTSSITEETTNHTSSILGVSTCFYGVFAVIGYAIAHWSDVKLVDIFSVDFFTIHMANIGSHLTEIISPTFNPVTASSATAVVLKNIVGIGAGVAAAVFLLCLSYFMERIFISYRELKGFLIRTFGACNKPTVLYLAFISAFAEELLFRVAIQPHAGILLTSILFGLMHIGQDGRISAWTIWAVGAGGMLGWIYEVTQLFLPIFLTHFIVNAFSMIRLQKDYKAITEMAKKRSREASS